LSKQLRLDVAQLTDVGRKRPHNEDNMAYVIPLDEKVMMKKGALFIVADGMGGHAAGEVASEIAVDTVSRVYYEDDNEDVAVSLVQAIKRANALIHQRAAENMTRSGMGTTCVASVLRGNMAYIANVGDSRAYMLHHNDVKQVSQDHSWVEEQVRAGLLTQEQARSHAQRNVITRSLGTQSDVEIDMFIEQLEEGDVLVLCSDGLSGQISDQDLHSIIGQFQPQESVYRLVERANENGGPDNITAIVMRVMEVGSEPAGVRHPVPVGGRELSNEDTAILSQLPSGIHRPSQRADGGRTTSAPLRMNSGILSAPGSSSAAYKSLVPTRSRRRNRLLYPSLAVLLLCVVALTGGGFYLLNRSGNVDQKLDIVSQDIKNANTSLTKNDPLAALIALSQAQSAFPKDSLTTDQSKRLDDLRKLVASTLKQAYSHYNQQNNITDLTCAVTKTTATTEPTVSVNLKNLAVVKNGTKEFFYTLGDDHALYLFDAQMQQLSKVVLKPDSYVEMIAGDNTRLIVLTSQQDTQSPPRSYKLYTFQPDAQGNLPTGTEADIDKNLTSQGNFMPSALAAWGSDIFLALASKATTSNITLLYYSLGNNNQFARPQQSTSTITSTANTIVSMVAFQKRQLFLLDNAGGLNSVQFVNGSTSPIALILQGKMPAPLNIDAQQYNAATPVPTPSTTNSSPFLQFSGATGMAAGTLSDDPDPHLFILDGTMNRILELKVVPSASVTSSITSATPTTVAGGGGAMASGLSVQLLNQFVSPNALYAARALVVDPSSSQNMLYVLAQDTQVAGQHTFLQINARQKNASCS
jgi:serine/threonine protein phosphatase PrpC